jgi:hypothetical protein
MRALQLLSAVLALTLAPHLCAAEEDLSCRNGLFTEEQSEFGIAKVLGGPKVHLIDDGAGCPSREARCAARAYLTPGDEVITGRRHGDFICVFYPGKGGGSAGWLPAENLKAPPKGPAGEDGWVGRWVDGDDVIALRRTGTEISARGDGYWPSAHPPRSIAPGGPNLGAFAGAGRPAAGLLTIVDGACAVTLRRVGRYLLATDNRGCGGLNVTFTGVYGRD